MKGKVITVNPKKKESLKLLIVDDDDKFRDLMGKILLQNSDGFVDGDARKVLQEASPQLELNLHFADSQEEAIDNYLKDNKYDIAFVDLLLKTYKQETAKHALENRQGGLRVINAIRQSSPETTIILLTGAFDAILEEDVFNPILKGEMYHFLVKGGDQAFKRQLLLEIRRVWKTKNLTQEMDALIASNSGLLGHHPEIQKIRQMIGKVAPYDFKVLITGETGTGKELVANAIHKNSLRNNYPFVSVVLSALAPGLFESELFGHVKGAFPNAIRDRIGRFEEADCGTIFLDEIGDLTEELQVKLLRMLQEKEIERVGDNKKISADVRVIAATNQNLEEAVKNGSFREDLYYRLNEIHIHVPPLRERKDDIPLLRNVFLEEFNKLQRHDQKKSISPEAKKMLQEFDWPGNVRQLRSYVIRLAVLGSSEISVEDIQEYTDIAGVAQGETAQPLVGLAGGMKQMSEEQKERLKSIRTYIKNHKNRIVEIYDIQLALDLLAEKGTIKNEDLRKATQIQSAKASAILTTLVDIGCAKKGPKEGQSTSYIKLT